MSKAVANLTQLNETITFSAQDNGETINVKINELARGPAGADGPNSVTSATTSDGTANLSLSNVTTATATVTGTLTADHIHGNLAGSVYAHVRAGENLVKGDPVYVSGSHGTGANLIAIVSKADASDLAKMPAIGIMDAALANNASGHMVITGQVYDINTAAYAANAELFVAAGGGLTDSAPLQYAQPVARVERSNTNNGAIIVKVNGLSSLGLPSTLVRRNAAGASSFTSLDVGSAGQISLSSSGVAIASGTITTSQPLSLTQTWNASGVTFKGIDVNVTDTASASGSLLMDLRVGGNPYFSIEKDGSTRLYRTYSSSTNFERLNLKYTGTAFQIGTEKGSSGGTARPLEFQTDGTTRMTIASDGSTAFSNNVLLNSGSLYLSSIVVDRSNQDIVIDRASPGTIRQRSGTQKQSYHLHDTFTSITDYHRLAIATARATATAMSGATVTLTNIIPKGAVVVGVTCKVTTAITGATSFDIGTAADPDRFGAAIGVALATTSDNTNWTAGGIECFTAATDIILTANGGNFTAGAVYVSVQYMSGQAD